MFEQIQSIMFENVIHKFKMVSFFYFSLALTYSRAHKTMVSLLKRLSLDSVYLCNLDSFYFSASWYALRRSWKFLRKFS